MVSKDPFFVCWQIYRLLPLLLKYDLQGWEKLDRSQDEGGEGGDDAPEDHTIVIQDEYNDEVVEDIADEKQDDADFDASGSVKKIVGTSPK